mgnify:CR=1 FL=1
MCICSRTNEEDLVYVYYTILFFENTFQMVRWNETFWGEGNRGFEVLSTNVKNAGIAIEEFQRFLNERFN